MAQNSNNNDCNNDNRSIRRHIKKNMSIKFILNLEKNICEGYEQITKHNEKFQLAPPTPNTKEAAVWERKAMTLDGDSHCIQSL